MFKNYLKIALRNLLRHKGYSLINMSGLGVGIACCLLITLYVRHELSYDRFHEKADRIFRVIAETGRDGQMEFESANTSFPIGPALANVFPEVEEAVRFRQAYQAVVTHGDEHFAEARFYFVDPAVFKVFSFAFETPMLGATALAQPNTVVLARSTARKYFGDEDAIGKTLFYQGSGGARQLTVTGVLRDLPGNSHFDFEFLASMLSLDTAELSWTWFTSLWTYVLLPENYPPEQLIAKFPAFVERHLPAKDKIDPGETMIMGLEPLTDIHLHSRLDKQMKPNSDIKYVRLFAIIGLFVLVIACINFMNLATAASLQRAKEVGMRKTLGAQRANLIRQFLGESFLFTGIAMVLGLVAVEAALPALNAFMGKTIALRFFNDGFIWLALLVLATFVGFVSGSYPAFVLSGFKPVAVLKSGRATPGGWSAGVRKTLVVFQFAVTIVLIIGTAVVYCQLEFIRHKNLGAKVDQVVVIPYSENVGPIMHELRQNPNVLSATASSRVPVNIESFDTRPMLVEGFDKAIQMENFNIDESFLATYNIELVAGRNLSREIISDSSAFLINEAAVKHFGWASPAAAVGKRLGWQNGFRWGEIVGVVKDFHIVSLHEPIQPLVMTKLPEHYWYNYISVLIQPAETAATLRYLEKVWRTFTPAGGFEYFFVDESFARLHRQDERFGQIVAVFAAISIFIACLGLLGLAAFAAERRTKEIGIRKVLGATITSVAALLSKDFVKLVLFANLIAWPIAWYMMNRWLQDFAYRVEIGWRVFALAGGIALLIALLTVSTQAIKAALANPVEALRYE